MDGARTRPWRRDTLVIVASTSKGLTGLVGNMLIEQGLLDPQAPVSRYWPEYAAAGKDATLVCIVCDRGDRYVSSPLFQQKDA
jgi:CubicO group peptidase (beta-lactamase class C family)